MRMQNLAAGLIALTAIAGVYPAAAAQEDKKAVEVLAGARKAIGGKKLDSLKPGRRGCQGEDHRCEFRILLSG